MVSMLIRAESSVTPSNLSFVFFLLKFLCLVARDIAENASKLLQGTVMATDRSLNGKVFASEGEAASEASEFFSLYYGGTFFSFST